MFLTNFNTTEAFSVAFHSGFSFFFKILSHCQQSEIGTRCMFIVAIVPLYVEHVLYNDTVYQVFKGSSSWLNTLKRVSVQHGNSRIVAYFSTVPRVIVKKPL